MTPAALRALWTELAPEPELPAGEMCGLWNKHEMRAHYAAAVTPERLAAFVARVLATARAEERERCKAVAHQIRWEVDGTHTPEWRAACGAVFDAIDALKDETP